MAIKLKNIKYSSWFKLLAIVIGVMGIIQGYIGFKKYHDFRYAVQNRSYVRSDIFEQKINNIKPRVEIIADDKSEEYIKSGSSITKNQINARINELNYSMENEIRNINDDYEWRIDDYTSKDKVKELKTQRDNHISQVKSKYKDRIDNVKDTLIKEELIKFKEANNYLKNCEGLNYSYTSGSTLIGPPAGNYNNLPYFLKEKTPGGNTVYFGFNKETFIKSKTYYDERHNNGIDGIIKLINGFILVMLSLIWFAYTAGRNRKNDDVNINLLDKLYLEISLATTILIFYILGFLLNILWASQRNGYTEFVDIASITCISLMYVTLAAYLVTLAKRLKRSETIKHTLIYHILRFVYKILCKYYLCIRDSFNSRPASFKIIGSIAAYFILLYIFIVINYLLVVLYAILTFYFLLKRINGYASLTEGVKKIKEGNMSYKILPCGSYLIDSVSSDVNNIAEGLKVAVESGIKSESMKVELITNVSHDLKTPLTSIISYTDLLYKGNYTPEQGREYIGILKEKSEKLKNLVEDLFEVSKAHSGSIPLQVEKLCLNDLIKQSLGEYEERFEYEKLELKLNIPENKVMILADGAKMWRVLSNIINNTLKYSMSGTRVYIDIETIGNNAEITFKNIARYSMNFKPEEIFERFKRGDDSRSGEGSGLGLAIVKSFMDLQKGSSEICIDGDLFKIKLTIPLSDL